MSVRPRCELLLLLLFFLLLLLLLLPIFQNLDWVYEFPIFFFVIFYARFSICLTHTLIFKTFDEISFTEFWPKK
jgi:hypothetical protein